MNISIVKWIFQVLSLWILTNNEYFNCEVWINNEYFNCEVLINNEYFNCEVLIIMNISIVKY